MFCQRQRRKNLAGQQELFYKSYALPVCLAFVIGFFAHSPLATAQTPPNIVIIMADDLDSGALYAALEEGFMPNLQSAIIDTGTEFSESFVSFPLCCPSRATFLTGLYPHNHDILWNTAPAGGFESFDDSSTLATWLQDTGYYTGHVGKYLNGYDDGTYVPPGWNEWYTTQDDSTYCMYNYTVSEKRFASRIRQCRK